MDLDLDWSFSAFTLLGMALIFLARIVDVSLDTLRLLSVVNGRKLMAWTMGFFQVLVWLLAVSSVITNIRDQPWFAVAYALGFATGNSVGIMIEQWLGHGEQVVRVFTRRGAEVATLLRSEGYGVTEFNGRGKDGAVAMLFIEVQRKFARKVADLARGVDPECFFILDDVRVASTSIARGSRAPRGE